MDRKPTYHLRTATLAFLAIISMIVVVPPPARADQTVSGGTGDSTVEVTTERVLRQPQRHSPEAGHANNPGQSRKRSYISQPSRTSNPAQQILFHTFNRSLPLHGVFERRGNTFTATRNACNNTANYTITQTGDFVSERRVGSGSLGGVRTVESITRTLATGAERSNGYACLGSAAPGQPGAAPAAGTPGAPGAAPEPIVIIVTQEEFASLPITPLVASAGPPDGWLPVNMANVLYAEPEVQTLDTELLGTPVAVRAIPVSFHWDLGDGNTITTSTPGKPYPAEDVSATYTSEGWYDITLTTTFAGQFSVDGGEWQDIDGTIEVSSDPIPLYSKSLESRLVNPDVPVDESEDPWIPPRTPETEGPKDPQARHREI